MAQPSEASDLDDVATQRMAASDEIDASNAQATQEQRARSGLMGGGLSGASSAMEGDLARQQGRGKVLAMQDFDRQAEDDDFTDIQRAAAIADLEDAYEADINGDGVIGGFNRGMFGGEDGVVGGTPMQGANETGADYGARVIGNKQKQNAGQYKDAIERSSPGDNGRAVAADEQGVYYKDFDTGEVFKVSKANNK